ncbi:MAG: hypothetical protein Q4D98_03405 [Planctomycetia bacterium]|nr:hypothetical protein [Planctomycetia bacterium]
MKMDFILVKKILAKALEQEDFKAFQPSEFDCDDKTFRRIVHLLYSEGFLEARTKRSELRFRKPDETSIPLLPVEIGPITLRGYEFFCNISKFS